MRLFAITFLSLITLVLQQQNPPIPPKKPSIQKRDTGKEAKHKDTQTYCVDCSTVEQNYAAANHPDSYDPRHDPLYRTYLGAAILGSIISVVGLWFLYLQAQSTQKAAEAASSNAAAVVASERAWIDIEVNGEASSYTLSVINYGRTIAKIETWEVAPVAVHFKGTLENPPNFPTQTLRRNKINRLVTPDGKPAFLDFLPIADFFSDDWRDITFTYEKKAYFFVRVGYEDTAGYKHTTEACYMYSIPSNRFVNMPERKTWS